MHTSSVSENAVPTCCAKSSAGWSKATWHVHGGRGKHGSRRLDSSTMPNAWWVAFCADCSLGTWHPLGARGRHTIALQKLNSGNARRSTIPSRMSSGTWYFATRARLCERGSECARLSARLGTGTIAVGLSCGESLLGTAVVTWQPRSPLGVCAPPLGHPKSTWLR